VTSVTYHRAIVIGIGDLGNATLTRLRQMMPNSEGRVRLRGFHRVPSKVGDWSYPFDIPGQSRGALGRADIRGQYLWHLENRPSALFSHITNTFDNLPNTDSNEVLIYIFADLQDPLSALMLDIFHLVSYLLKDKAPSITPRWLINIAMPSPSAYDAGQFATMREWLRFTFGNVEQNLFPTESPFAFLNINHATLFNRLFIYDAHPQLAHLWAEVGMAQLQNTQEAVADDTVYSRQFLEHNVSNYSNRLETQLHVIAIANQAQLDRRFLLCSAFAAYSIAMPTTYLYACWQSDFATRLLTMTIGTTAPSAEKEALTRLADWRDMPPFMSAIVQKKPILLMNMPTVALQQHFISPSVLPMRLDDFSSRQIPQTKPKALTTAQFLTHYIEDPYQLGDIYDLHDTNFYSDGMTRRYAPFMTTTLTDALTQAIERWLGAPFAQTNSAGGVVLAVACLKTVVESLAPFVTMLDKDIATLTSHISQRKRLNELTGIRLLATGHVSRFGKLTPLAETYLKDQADDVLRKERCITLMAIRHIVSAFYGTAKTLYAQLQQWMTALMALDETFRATHKQPVRPINSPFCAWIQDEPWENERQAGLWTQLSVGWMEKIRWQIEFDALELTIGNKRLSANITDVTINQTHWLGLVDLSDRDVNLWDDYLTDEYRAMPVFNRLKQMIEGRYYPIHDHTSLITRAFLPSAPSSHAGKSAFMTALTHQFAPQEADLIAPSGDRITYFVEYNEQPLQGIPHYEALYEKYRLFLNRNIHHLFVPERTAVTYELYDNRRLLSAPVVALFEYETRLKLFVLLDALGYLCDQPLDDTMRYFGVMVGDECAPLTEPSHDPSWYLATYQFVWKGKTVAHQPRTFLYSTLQTECDAMIKARMQAISPETGQGTHWERIRKLLKFRTKDHDEIRTVGVLMDIYTTYQQGLVTMREKNSNEPIISDLYTAFTLIAQSEREALEEKLARYNV